VDASEAGEQFNQILDRVCKGKTRVVVEKDGSPVAAIISAADLERLIRWEEQRREDFAILHRMQAAFQDVPDDELEREVAKALAEVRAEERERKAREARST
jgi:prevent-host-death family protein